MKKALLSIAFLLMVSFVFTSCGDEDEKIDKIDNNQQNYVDPDKVKPPKNG
jgi:hypothetical protein